jgi:ABC-2 type transport system ATP-binding protein
MSKKKQPVIQTIELSKVYKDFWGRSRVRALDSLNLTINQGEVFGLLGPNGSGKTTTVRLLLGLLFPSRGAVRIFGKNPREVKVKQKIGYMPEESHLYDYLNAEETLDFFGRLFGLTRSERRRRTSALIEMVGLQRARHRAIGEFSKGMARRIGLAQALINDPDLLILDEPTTGLDPLGSREMKRLIEMMKNRGKTVLLCSHLLADVEQVCDRVAILYGGRIQSSGAVSELLTDPEKTEIRTPKLPSEAIEEIRQVVRKYSGDTGNVEVGAPSRNLEDYFLKVIEEARREKIETAGAEAGGPAAAFLSDEKETGERLIEELMTKDKSRSREEEGPEARPVPARETGDEDRKIIERLIQAEGDEDEETSPEPAAPPEEEKAQENIIRKLMHTEEEEEPEEREKD